MSPIALSLYMYMSSGLNEAKLLVVDTKLYNHSSVGMSVRGSVMTKSISVQNTPPRPCPPAETIWLSRNAFILSYVILSLMWRFLSPVVGSELYTRYFSLACFPDSPKLPKSHKLDINATLATRNTSLNDNSAVVKCG